MKNNKFEETNFDREKLIENFLDWNEKINVSGIKNYEWVKQKHILDSLELNKIINIPQWKTLADLGTGGGFPLLPLAITNPQADFIGIESKKKKVKVVKNLIQECQIKNAQIIRTRGENHNKKYDFVTARAVAYIDELLDYSYNLVKKGGKFIFYKSNSQEEYESLKKQCNKYHLDIEKKHEYTLFKDDIDRIIYILSK